MSSGPSAGSRRACPASEGRPEDLVRSGRGRRTAVATRRHLRGELDVLLALDARRWGWVERAVTFESSWLPEPGALTLGERHVVQRAVVHEVVLALQTCRQMSTISTRAAIVLSGADTVEALRSTRGRGTETEDEASAGERVEAGRGHRDQRGVAGCRAGGRPRRSARSTSCRQVAHVAHPSKLYASATHTMSDPGRLEFHDPRRRGLVVAGVVV